MRKEVSWQWNHLIGLALSFYRGNFQTNWRRPNPVRGLKLHHEPCFYYLQTIIVFQYRHSVGQRHTFHIIHLLETTVLYILPDIWDDGKNRLSIINFSNNGTIPSDICSVGKVPIAMFEFTSWHTSFTDFFIKLRLYIDIGKQYFFQMTDTGFAEKF